MQQTSETSHARPASADHARRSAAREGGLARLTAASLTAAGLQVTGPDTDGRLVIACRAVRCELTVSDSADAELFWTPFAAEADDPHRVADLAAALLVERHPGCSWGGRFPALCLPMMLGCVFPWPGCSSAAAPCRWGHE
jgi:hypothetical protein